MLHSHLRIGGGHGGGVVEAVCGTVGRRRGRRFVTDRLRHNHARHRHGSHGLIAGRGGGRLAMPHRRVFGWASLRTNGGHRRHARHRAMIHGRGRLGGRAMTHGGVFRRAGHRFRLGHGLGGRGLAPSGRPLDGFRLGLCRGGHGHAGHRHPRHHVMMVLRLGEQERERDHAAAPFAASGRTVTTCIMPACM